MLESVRVSQESSKVDEAEKESVKVFDIKKELITTYFEIKNDREFQIPKKDKKGSYISG